LAFWLTVAAPLEMLSPSFSKKFAIVVLPPEIILSMFLLKLYDLATEIIAY
jgi:hypothetical protein